MQLYVLLVQQAKRLVLWYPYELGQQQVW